MLSPASPGMAWGEINLVTIIPYSGFFPKCLSCKSWMDVCTTLNNYRGKISNFHHSTLLVNFSPCDNYPL